MIGLGVLGFHNEACSGCSFSLKTNFLIMIYIGGTLSSAFKIFDRRMLKWGKKCRMKLKGEKENKNFNFLIFKNKIYSYFFFIISRLIFIFSILNSREEKKNFRKERFSPYKNNF